MTLGDGPSIGQRIAHYRRMNGWTMEELAELTDDFIKRDVIANIENGRKKDVSVQQLLSLAVALGVPAGVLVFNLERAVEPSGLSITNKPLNNYDGIKWLSGSLRRPEYDPPRRAANHTFDSLQLMKRADHLERLIKSYEERERAQLLKKAKGAKAWTSDDELILEMFMDETRNLRETREDIVTRLAEIGIKEELDG